MRGVWLGETPLAPVAALRIVYGVLLFNWFWQLFPDLTPFFTDIGILPRASAVALYDARASLLFSAGEWWQVAAVWAAGLVAAAALTLGAWTRPAAIAAFLLCSAFQWRNPLILDGSDILFRVIPFWLAFTRAGDLWSIDALRRGVKRRTGPAIPVRILELQIAWVYLASGLEKLGGTRWLDGTALYYALSLEHTFARPHAQLIAQNDAVVRIGTWGTLALELAFLFLVFAPVAQPLLRLVAVAGAAALHLGIIAFMNVGNFPAIMLAALLLFVPPIWLEDVGARVRARMRLPGPPDTPRAAPVPARRREPLRAAAYAVLAVVALLAFATALPAQARGLRPSGAVAEPIVWLGIDQRWDMFSPDPLASTGWMEGPAVLADGTRIDLFADRRHTTPRDAAPRYADPLYSRWAKVHERISSVDFRSYRLEYARMYCRTRNLERAPGQPPLVSFELDYVEVRIPPAGRPREEVRHELWDHRC